MVEIKCRVCGNIKPDTEYYEIKGCTGGRRKTCKKCASLYSALYNSSPRARARRHQRQSSPKYLQQKREYYYRNRDTIRAKQKKYSQTAEYRRNRSEERERVRAEIFSHYGGARCICCGESNRIFLTIDHVNNDGNKHRKALRGKNNGAGVRSIYPWLKSHGFPPGFQVLCYNCNAAKHLTKGNCPHRKALPEVPERSQAS